MGGKGGGEWGEGGGGVLVLPSHRQPKSIGGGETSLPDPEAPPTMVVLRGGVSGEGIKRWGIEGIRIGTSDRFGQGRGE